MTINQDFARLQVKQDLNRITRLNKSSAPESTEQMKLKEAADGFEELFTHKLMQVMRSSTPKSGILSGGRGEEIFQDMLDENYSKIITKSGALGLSKVIYDNAKESLKKS